MQITKETWDLVREYHKEGYEKHFIPNSLLNLAGLLCFVIILFTNPYASPVFVAAFVIMTIAAKRDGHREGFVDGVSETSSLYGSAKSRKPNGEIDEDFTAYDLLETPEFIKEMERTLKELKEYHQNKDKVKNEDKPEAEEASRKEPQTPPKTKKTSRI